MPQLPFFIEVGTANAERVCIQPGEVEPHSPAPDQSMYTNSICYLINIFCVF